MDYKRQLELFDPRTFTTPVHVVGAGAVGSWVTLLLAKLGVKDITVYDFDVVEAHNLPNQAYSLHDVGEAKVTALHRIVKEQTGIDIKVREEKVTTASQLRGYVFLAVDSMAGRKRLWEAAKFNFNIKAWIETRMGLTSGRIYTVDPTDPIHVKKYSESFSYTDEQASTSACGASQTVVTTASLIASLAVQQMLNLLNKQQVMNEIYLGTHYPSIVGREYQNQKIKTLKEE